MPPNLADPSVEPTDEELQGLSRDAFANVKAENAAARQRVRARIVELRAESLRQARASRGR
ncbi:MAG TPA: hypothetical protein VL463_30110 [Kofleriaceae bacterium]|nr:hypothetical protein [Kofleriaceae bacterium]